MRIPEHFEEWQVVGPNEQMLSIRDMLDAGGIPWHDASDDAFCRTHSDATVTVTDRKGRKVDKRLFSVVCGRHSYGGKLGLLEAWVAGDPEPVGYLTASDAMDRIRGVL